MLRYAAAAVVVNPELIVTVIDFDRETSRSYVLMWL